MNDSDAVSKVSHIPAELLSLGSYAWPQGEAQQTLTHLLEKITNKLPWFSTRHVEPERNLHSIQQQGLMDEAHARLSDYLCRCLDDGYVDWVQQDGPGLRALVTAPMPSDLLGTWARSHDVPVMSDLEELEKLQPNQPAVLPNFEKYLSRRYDKLPALLQCQSLLARPGLRVIVGCNSWAWRYLTATTSLELLVPTQHTIPAFGDSALAGLLSSVLEKNRDIESIVSEDSGDPIFVREDGELTDPYFAKLAKRSLGLPWVAIKMFFDDLLAADDADGDQDDTRTWLRLPPVATLPEDNSQLSCIALQNLLIHGPCTPERLCTYLPKTPPVGLWSALERCGFVTLNDGVLHHCTSAYPAIRTALGAAGLNLDKL